MRHIVDAQAPWNVEYVLNTETGMRTVRSNYMASMSGCYTTFDNLPDSSEVWNELEKEPGSIGKAALMKQDFKAAWITPPEQQPVLQMMRGLRDKVGLPELELIEEADRWKPME